MGHCILAVTGKVCHTYRFLYGDPGREALQLIEEWRGQPWFPECEFVVVDETKLTMKLETIEVMDEKSADLWKKATATHFHITDADGNNRVVTLYTTPFVGLTD